MYSTRRPISFYAVFIFIFYVFEAYDVMLQHLSRLVNHAHQTGNRNLYDNSWKSSALYFDDTALGDIGAQ
jgi:hypothetical protein